MDSIKIAIIGCGKQAPKHINGLRSIPGVELVLADINADIAEQLGKAEDIPWLESPEAVFTDSTIQAIDICTPTPSHFGLIQQAVASDKDFFCEKPLCETVAEARDIQQMVTQAGRIGMIGYVYRFAPIFQLGYGLFMDVPATSISPVLGRTNTAYFRLGGRGSHQLWKHRKETGGGAINEMLVHMIDLAIWYFGSVQDIEIFEKRLHRPIRLINGKEVEVDAEDYVLIRLLMSSGVEVICQADLLTPAFSQWIEVQGDNGTFMGSIQGDMPSFVYCSSEAAGYQSGKTVLNFGYRNLFETQMAEFVRAVRMNQPPPRSTVRDSVLLMEALDLLRTKELAYGS